MMGINPVTDIATNSPENHLCEFQVETGFRRTVLGFSVRYTYFFFLYIFLISLSFITSVQSINVAVKSLQNKLGSFGNN